MLSREEALSLVKSRVRDDRYLKHMLAVEAIMEKLAERLGGDPETWGLAGLLHDLDFEETKDDPARHGLKAAQELEGKVPSEVVEAIKRYGWSVGIAFQIMDDLLDVFGREEKIGKKVGKDIIEHKLGNVVVALAAEELSGSDREELLGILRKPEVGDEDVKRAIELISRTRARERAGEMMRRYVDEALKALELLPEGDAKQDLRDLAVFIITREY